MRESFDQESDLSESPPSLAKDGIHSIINSDCASDEKLGQSEKILKSVNDPLRPTTVLNCKSSAFI